MRSLPADDDTHPRRPSAQESRVEQAGELGNVAAFTDTTVGVECRRPDLRRHQVDGLAQDLGEGESHAVLHAPATDLALLGEPVQQAMPRASAIGADQQPLAVGGGDLGDRLAQHLDVVGGGVRPGVACPEPGGEELNCVVAPDPDRVVAEGPLERRRCLLLLRVSDGLCKPYREER